MQAPLLRNTASCVITIPSIIHPKPLVCAVLGLHVHVVAARQDLRLGNVIGRSSAGCHGHDLAVLVDELKIVPAEKMRDGRKLGAISSGIVVELEEWDCQ